VSGPQLYPTADWAPNEAIHLLVEDLGIDSLLRTFDSLAADSVFDRITETELDICPNRLSLERQ